MNTFSYEEARRFLEIAQKGDERIVTSLAIAYYEGYGVEQDYAKALECYQKAAELGYDVAQCDLAYMYKTGKGTPKDMEKAFYWYMKSAEQGFSDAQLELGVLYHNGTGVKQDYMKSYYWYKKAADQGNVKAQENINLMLFFNEITEEDIKAEESPKKRKDAKTLLKGLEASDFIQQGDELFESGSFELAKVNYTGAYARDSRFAFYCYYRLAWIEEIYDNHEEALQLCEYGAGKAVAKVEPESCDKRMIPAIIDVNVSGGTNEGINKFNGEQLHHVGIVVEKGDYYVTEKSISVLFDHVRGDIAIVRAVNLDFSISKGYLVKCLDNERQTRYFFGKTLRQAMKSRMAFLNS